MRMLDHVQLKPNDRAATERAAQILRQRFPIEQVILFGSKARGEDDAESDIDLLVLTSQPLSARDRDAVVDSPFDLQLELGVVLSPGRSCSMRNPLRHRFIGPQPAYGQAMCSGTKVRYTAAPAPSFALKITDLPSGVKIGCGWDSCVSQWVLWRQSGVNSARSSTCRTRAIQAPGSGGWRESQV